MNETQRIAKEIIIKSTAVNTHSPYKRLKFPPNTRYKNIPKTKMATALKMPMNLISNEDIQSPFSKDVIFASAVLPVELKRVNTEIKAVPINRNQRSTEIKTPGPAKNPINNIGKTTATPIEIRNLFRIPFFSLTLTGMFVQNLRYFAHSKTLSERSKSKCRGGENRTPDTAPPAQ